MPSETEPTPLYPRPSPNGTGRAHAHRATGPLVGEVIESSTTEFAAQACELGAAPELGAFVRVPGDGGLALFGVVARVETGGIDAGARPIMRGHGDVRDERIYAENPDLPHVLRTLFRVAVVGFEQDGVMYQYLPPQPPRLHYSVHLAAADDVRAFTDAGLMYLGSLLRLPDAPTDDLLAANVRLAALQRAAGGELLDRAFAEDAGRELAQLLRADYARFTGILRRLVPGLRP